MMEILTCPLCCSSSLTDFGTVFERRYDHRPDDGNVITAHEVITHHAVFKCSECSASSINGPGVDVPGELVAGVMRRKAKAGDAS